MSKTFTKLTRPAMRKLAAGDKLNEHGITFERQANSDGVFSVNVMASAFTASLGVSPTARRARRQRNLSTRRARMRRPVA